MQLEKQTRLGADMVSCSRVLCAIVQICFEARNWNALNEHIALLVKRRSQLKQAVVKMVQECCTYVDQITEKDNKLKLIDTLRTVTEGKIYVEVERARLTKILANIREADGDIVGAANVMEELQVETYGTMEKREKVELILEQMRLCLAKQDLVRAQIIAKKISIKFFDDPKQEDLKYKYYCIMVRIKTNTILLRISNKTVYRFRNFCFHCKLIKITFIQSIDRCRSRFIIFTYFTALSSHYGFKNHCRYSRSTPTNDGIRLFVLHFSSVR